MRYVTTIEEREYIVEILDEHHVVVDGVIFNVDFVPMGAQPVYSLIVDGQSYDIHIYPENELWQVLFLGALYSAVVEDEREKRLRAAMGGGPVEHGEFLLKAPMPGMVVSIPVKAGQEVAKGEVLLVLESMKMQNELKSPRAGVIARLRVQTGDRVEKQQTLLTVV